MIFFDDDYKCYVDDGGTMTAVETNVFAGKCSAYIEGYRFVPEGKTWTCDDGRVFTGEMVSPWKPWSELDAAQREYEREQLAALKAQNADMAAALAVLGVDA